MPSQMALAAMSLMEQAIAINKQSKWDYRFLELAELVASWSKDPSTKTGAVIVGPDNGVISVGFNGFPSGMLDDASLYDNRDEKYSRIIHCEVNALLHAGRVIPEGSTLYTTPFMSCDRCVVQMLGAGIKRFVAPITPSNKLERWGEIFRKTRKYIDECGGQLIEIGDNKDEDLFGGTVQGSGKYGCDRSGCSIAWVHSHT